MGYAAIDAANRILQDQPLVPEGVGLRAVDKSTVASSSGAYESPIDWKSAYQKLWSQ
jgi:hypothetical protein